jgi:hypothetical protein
VNFFNTLVIKQGTNDMQVGMQNFRQAGLKALYKFDGSRVNIEAPEGLTETATASWDGSRLVISARRSFTVAGFGEVVTESKEIWTLAANGKELRIEKTRTADVGVPDTKTAVYDRYEGAAQDLF